MIVSGPRQRHLLLDANAGWRSALLDRTVRPDAMGRLRLRPLPRAAGPVSNLAADDFAVQALALDSAANVYALDAERAQVSRFDESGDPVRVLPCVGGPGSAPYRFAEPLGIAISECGNLYVADAANRRVQVFALKGLLLRAIWGPLRLSGTGSSRTATRATPSPSAAGEGDELTWPPGTWRPADVAVGGSGRAYVCDPDNDVVHVLDANGRWLRSLDRDESAAFERPTRIAVDGAESIYVLQESDDHVAVIGPDGTFRERIGAPEGWSGPFVPEALAVARTGELFVSTRGGRRIEVYATRRDGTHEYAGSTADLGAVVAAIALDACGNLVIFDGEQRLQRCVTAEGAFETEGRYLSEPLDSALYRCQWHRVVLRATVVTGTTVRVDTFTSESEKTLSEIRMLPEDRWATGVVHSSVDLPEWDCLVQSPPGRYLWLRLTLLGNGSATPVISLAKVFYPRSSPARYLPAIYREDPVGDDFLGRFLSIFDSTWTVFGDTIDSFARHFDPDAVPADGVAADRVDFLSWLASWLDLSLDQHWPVAKRRALLRQAHRLYALRGTLAGLRLHVKLYTGSEPRILEHFRLRRWLYLGAARLGDRSALWGDAVVARLQLDRFSRVGSFQLIDSDDPLRDPFHHLAHRFTVFVPLPREASDTETRTLERIVELAKPAHALGVVRVAEPGLRVGIQSFVGVDTLIGRYPDAVTLGDVRLRHGTVLGPSYDEAVPPTFRVGVRSRIGSTTGLN